MRSSESIRRVLLPGETLQQGRNPDRGMFDSSHLMRPFSKVEIWIVESLTHPQDSLN